ncbi:UDP-2,3-diacylglucosamine diphosphatase LpxI [Tateyamaria omphalii]|uniref:LpxI family protein n=1 Tax=Tateyamaria omphalii TaxID=299262 RepID=UPI001C9A0554|nr:UDP-2,3-diacylglucosamine diphosphatase LpxI [Tateyamaria omphalii]MBY5932788.1 UDP-2,3-diacylglucosamine diphosphatase LpxI [Tateyamaria omphalii]
MLALITGTGALPSVVAREQSSSPMVCALEGYAPDELEVDHWFRIETIGTLLHLLKQRGVTDVCFCGAIQRPSFNPLRLDARTMPLVPTIAKAVKAGEDAALRAVIGLFETRGMTVRGAHELVPDLLPTSGVLSKTPVPNDIDMQVKAAEEVSIEQGRADEGQSCVIRKGQVIAREDARGTDAMLRGLLDRPVKPMPPAGDDPFAAAMDFVGDMLDDAADWLSGPVAEARAQTSGGIFFKAPKPGQDRRIDLPTIGPSTARAAIAARLDGLVLEAGGVMVLDRGEVVRLLDEEGLFLWVR